jgi:acid stress-induced BolA-like protein IbaG/YrbA
MHPNDVRSLILAAFPTAQVEVNDLTGGGDHFQATIVATEFQGLTMLKQHKLLYQSVQTYIDDGRIHALTLRTFSPEQWQKQTVQFEL